MLKTIVKRDGTEEPFAPHKVNSWSIWASEQLGERVDWSSVVMDSMQHFKEKATSQELQKQLIKVCVQRKSWPYSLMAGRLYAAVTRKEIYGSTSVPSIKTVHDVLAKSGLMRTLDYSDTEYEEIEKFINHERDYSYAYSQVIQLRKKYALRNRVNKREYESPQFVFMRMAMALAEDEPRAERLEHIVNWYNHFSFNRINAPSPNYVNLGTPLNGYASCCVYKVGDNLDSLAIGDHIAYKMTGMSAGIGGMLSTRSVGDPVRQGAIVHQGKLPYYRALAYATRANQQAGRGGAVTSYYSAFDPEGETIARLQNPMSTADKKIREMHFGVMYTRMFSKMAALNKEVFVFNEFQAPDLWKAMFSGNQDRFEALYEKYEADPEFPKVYINAREFVVMAAQQALEVGTHYELRIDEMNRHTPFNTEQTPIYSSNLCVAPHTLILTRNGEKPIIDLVDKEVEVWNGQEWSTVTIRKTGEKKELTRVHTSDGKYLDCTPEHRWYLKGKDGFTETKDIMSQVETIDWNVTPEVRQLLGFAPNDERLVTNATIVRTERLTTLYDTYCCTEPKRHMVVFNGILTGQCAEISFPTEAYYDMMDLYSTEDHGRGEVGICALAGIVICNIRSESQYRSAAYYALKMIDKCIDMSDYPFPHVAMTAKARRNAGVGILGLATDFARAGVRFGKADGLKRMHEIGERHYYFLLEASLRLAKELGNAPWMHKTHWPEGWLPIDTYKRTVDELTPPVYKYDWENLRSRIKEQGGIRHSVLVAHMPTESSSKSAGVPNSIYPIRELGLKKSDNTNILDWVATDSDILADKYQLAWDVETLDLIYHYAVGQKWTDQGISADIYANRSVNPVIYSDDLVKQHLAITKYGMKGRYYQNSLTSDAKVALADQEAIALPQAEVSSQSYEPAAEPPTPTYVPESPKVELLHDAGYVEETAAVVVETPPVVKPVPKKDHAKISLAGFDPDAPLGHAGGWQGGGGVDDDLPGLGENTSGCGSGSCTL